MDERGQFTFYRSFWEAIKSLPKKDKLPILEAIIQYALDGEQPVNLSQSQSAFFLLVKPNLDSSRKKASSGKQGGIKRKQIESKQEANEKQTESEKEREKEKENEIEIEKENDRSKQEAKPSAGSKPADRPKPQTTFDGQSFSQFWNAYPDCSSKISRENSYSAWKALAPSKEQAEKILESLEAWKKSIRWTDNGGEFIPSPANFLSKGYWNTTPASAKTQAEAPLKRELDSDEIEAIRRLMES